MHQPWHNMIVISTAFLLGNLNFSFMSCHMITICTLKGRRLIRKTTMNVTLLTLFSMFCTQTVSNIKANKIFIRITKGDLEVAAIDFCVSRYVCIPISIMGMRNHKYDTRIWRGVRFLNFGNLYWLRNKVLGCSFNLNVI